MNIDIEAIGFTKEELQQRIIDQICERLLSSLKVYQDGEHDIIDSPFHKLLDNKIKERIDQKISEIAESYVLPKVSEYIENIILQKTNEWGEKVSKGLTFKEYLVERANAYLIEKVDYEGKSKDENRGYSFSGTQTRIAHMIHKHLHYQIEGAMKDAVSKANSAIKSGIEETVKIKLAEIGQALQVSIKTK